MKRMRHNYCNNENKKQKKPELNLMSDALPAEILIDILLRLPVNSICCIKCVSKALLKTVVNPSFATLHIQRRFLTTTIELPQLVLHTKSPFPGHTMHLLKYDGNNLLTKSKQAIVSNFGCRQLVYTHNFVFCNLLGFIGHGDDYKNGNPCLLLNPLKGEVLKLPATSYVLQASANNLSRQDSYGMGFDNITNTYKIVRVSYHEKYKKSQPKCLYWGQTHGGSYP